MGNSKSFENKVSIETDDSMLDKVELLETVEKNNLKLELALNYLNQLKDVSRIISDKTCLYISLYLFNLSHSPQFRSCLNNQDLIIKNNFTEILSNIFSHCYKQIKFFLSENEYLNKPTNRIYEKDLKKNFFFVSYLIDVTCYLTQVSSLFRIKFHESDGTKNITQYLTDQYLVSNCLRFKFDTKEDKPIGILLLETFTQTLYYLSKNSDHFKKFWEEKEVVVKLMKYSNQIYDSSKILILTYLTVANIINEEEIEMLNNFDQVLEKIFELFNQISDSIKNKKNLKRATIELESNKQVQEVAIVDYKDLKFNLIELLESMNRIAVSDKMKFKIYKELKTCLKNIIINGNNLEKEYALNLLWQLCFDKNVNSDVIEDEELVGCLNSLNNQKQDNELLVKNVTGIIWLTRLIPQKSALKHERLKPKIKKLSLNNSTDSKISKILATSKQNADIDSMSVKEANKLYSQYQEPVLKKNHIMISYNRENRDLCLRIKEELENNGQDVWIDVEDISGSSLESMASAIENSKCVIICMTEKYKQSPNCRAEAEYSFNLRKPIIPLIMQKNYTPDGWLGIILGSKIFINFFKYPFDECMKKLNKEIENIIEKNDDSIKVNSINTALTNTENVQNVKNWSCEDVINWTQHKQIHPEIASKLNSINGELLIQFYKSFKHSPEFFYKNFFQNNKIELHSIIHFINELEKLF